MGAELRVLRRKIRSVQGTRKITRAMELVATSRIAKAQQRVQAAEPYTREITRVLTALASSSNTDHPLLVEREHPTRAAVVVVTSDRGLAGAYSANVLRTAGELMALLSEEGKESVLFVIGRKGSAYYRFRRREIAGEWTGFSEQPAYVNARDVGRTLVDLFIAGGTGPMDAAGGAGEGGQPDTGGGAGQPDAGGGTDGIGGAGGSGAAGAAGGPTGTDGTRFGVDEIHLVYTEFRSMLTQAPVVKRIAPMVIVESPEPPPEGYLPAYEFEPAPEILLDALLPKYLNTRIYAALLESAASESASRRRAMKSATDNADELIRNYTRQANQARQAEITQEISEIVGGADALVSAARGEG